MSIPVNHKRKYKVVRTDDNFENTLSILGEDGWKVVCMNNFICVLSKFSEMYLDDLMAESEQEKPFKKIK